MAGFLLLEVLFIFNLNVFVLGNYLLSPQFSKRYALPVNFDQGHKGQLIRQNYREKDNHVCPSVNPCKYTIEHTDFSSKSSFLWQNLVARPNYKTIQTTFITPTETKHYLGPGNLPSKPAVCGDGIKDFSEKCEFNVFCDTFPVPPTDYHCPYNKERAGSISRCHRPCRWGPLDPDACSPGVESKEIFLHYCGNGVIEIPRRIYQKELNSSRAFSQQNLLNILHDYSFTAFSTVCDYYDKDFMIPIYCNSTLNDSWNPLGKTYYTLESNDSTELCDMGSNNGKPGFGCTKDCQLLCANGRPDFSQFPMIPCQQPCFEGWTGIYCDTPRCQNGKISDDQDGNCIKGSCLSGFKGKYCDEIDCGHGRLEGLEGQKKCTCNLGWLGDRCNETFCASWDEKGSNCISCISGHFNPENYCLDTAPKSYCEHGEADTADLAGRCKQPCSAKIFFGPYCNITNCQEVYEMPKSWFSNPYESELSCRKCKQGYNGEYCLDYNCNTLNGEVDDKDPNKFCIQPCQNPRFLGPYCNVTHFSGYGSSCEAGFTTEYCNQFKCQNGVVDLLNNIKNNDYFCYSLSCKPGWTGLYCDQPKCEKFDVEVSNKVDRIFLEWKSASIFNSQNYLETLILSGGSLEDSVSQIHLNEIIEEKRKHSFKFPIEIDMQSICKNITENIFPPREEKRDPIRKSIISKCVYGAFDVNNADGACIKDSCFKGWEGMFCDSKKCYNDGQLDGSICQCKEGWYGEACETSKCSNGHRVSTSESPNCDYCFPGYEGIYCDISICPNGIFNPYYDPKHTSSRCLEGSCRGSLIGPDCSHIPCHQNDYDASSKFCLKCPEGFTGVKCDQVVKNSDSSVRARNPTTSQKVKKSNSFSFLAIIVLIFLVIVFSCFKIGRIFNNRRKRKLQKKAITAPVVLYSNNDPNIFSEHHRTYSCPNL